MANDLSPIQKIETDLRAPETLAEIKAVAPAGSDVERVIVAVMQAITRDRAYCLAMGKDRGALESCTPLSVRMCVLQAVELGLMPSGVMGDAWLVPYKGQCTLVPGYRGLARIAMESGAASAIHAVEVYAGEHFAWVEGSDPRIEHRPDIEKRSGEKKDCIAVYALATLPDGTESRAVMSKAQVEKIARAAQTDKVWSPHWTEMAKKTAIRRLCKQLPINPVKAPAFARLVELDDEHEARIIDVDARDVTFQTDEAGRPPIPQDVPKRQRAKREKPGAVPGEPSGPPSPASEPPVEPIQGDGKDAAPGTAQAPEPEVTPERKVARAIAAEVKALGADGRTQWINEFDDMPDEDDLLGWFQRVGIDKAKKSARAFVDARKK